MLDTTRSRYFLFVLVLGSYAVVFPLAALVGLNIDLHSLIDPFAFALSFIVLISALCHWRNIPMLRAGGECFGIGFLLTIPAVVTTYVAMRTNLPLADRQLAAMDAHLGLDWLSLIQFIDAQPYLAVPLTYAYESFSIQLLLLPLVLAIAGRFARAYQMVAAYGIICYISSLISVWYPALGTYPTFGIDRSALQNINGYFAFGFDDQLQQVRNDPNFTFKLQQAAGILSFPSVHAAVAALCAWAAWDVKWLRYPIALLNALMLFSAVTEGSHYVVDLVAGVGVSGFTIAMVLFFTRGSTQVQTATNIGYRGA